MLRWNRQVELINRNSRTLGDRAIVIGGSIAGLLSARVLSDYFQRVIVLDRDTLPLTPQARRGVPQSVQPHVLFTKGYRILAEWLSVANPYSRVMAFMYFILDWINTVICHTIVRVNLE